MSRKTNFEKLMEPGFIGRVRTINASLGRELEYVLRPADRREKVLVAGIEGTSCRNLQARGGPPNEDGRKWSLPKASPVTPIHLQAFLPAALRSSSSIAASKSLIL